MSQNHLGERVGLKAPKPVRTTCVSGRHLGFIGQDLQNEQD